MALFMCADVKLARWYRERVLLESIIEPDLTR